MPELWGGSADLGGSNKTDLKGAETFAPAECATKQWPNCSKYGRQLHFGVREFTMGTITNGILLGSHTRPYGGTFFMFSDYERSAVRLAALMQIPNLYVWSHDLSQSAKMARPTSRWSIWLPSAPSRSSRSLVRPTLTRPLKPTVTSSRRRTPCRPLWF